MPSLQLIVSAVFFAQIVLSRTTELDLLPNVLSSDNIIINFGPYVSILDSYNDSRYAVDDLIPLVSKVASRFKRIRIPIPYEKLYNGGEDITNSLLLSPMAVAKYNCLGSTKTKLDVTINLNSDSAMCSCALFGFLYYTVKEFVDKVNDECEGTIKTISKTANLCSKKYKFFECDKRLNRSGIFRQYQWIVRHKYSKISSRNHSNLYSDEHFFSDVVVLIFKDLEEFFEASFDGNLDRLKKYSQVKSIWYDINFRDRGYNMSDFISKWKSVLNIQNGVFIVNSAFDSYPEFGRSYANFGNGWWYLVNDSGKTDTKQFTFEEKFLVASKMDENENPKNFEWLNNKIVFNQSTTGIVVSDILDENLVNTFCRMYVLKEAKFTSNDPNKKTEHSSLCKPAMDLFAHANDYATLKLIESRILKYVENVSTTLLFRADYFLEARNDTLNFSERLGQIKIIDELVGINLYGYSFSLNVCGYFAKYQTNTDFINTLKDPKSSLYLFYYEETLDLVNLGATRMFRRIKVMFKACQEMVFGNRNHTTEIALALQGYQMNNHFYSSPLKLQNYVKYISFLNNWVGSQTNTIVLLGQGYDTMWNFGKDEKTVEFTAGWYSNNFNGGSRLKDKRQDALELSRSIFPPQSPKERWTLSDTTLNVHLQRKKFKNFSNGEKCDGKSNNPDEAPYDKNKYEIPSTNFSIQDELGSGEYGKVSRGKIISGSNERSVAIKTSNPKTVHKTVLKGLLSEIKVLAYLGKNQHVIELLGANTENLKNGKVYVFLELCQLGSLDKVLKEIGQHLSALIVEPDSMAMENQYVNTQNGTETILDADLSEDLLKWSVGICNGMAYLAEKHVVHADLATRNVLLNLRKETKICDFGLSRRMYNYTIYVKCQQEPLPWKWMAPESLNYMTFSEKSDVWAYGVTLWEVYSLGKSPYPGLSWDINFAGMLERGLRLAKPEFVEKNMYSVMTKCWTTDEKQRPTFMELQELLNKPITTATEIPESAV